VDEIISKFDLTHGGQFAVPFQLWTERHKGELLFRRIDLDPKRSDGHTFRYATAGWGLIQLYFGGLENNELNQSHIGHFNEKGAVAKAASGGFNGKVNSWDWGEIQKSSRKIKYHLHSKLAVRKMGSAGVLAGAMKMEQQGVLLR
jgi:hypothetical protein